MLPDAKSRCPSLAPLLQPQRRKFLFGGIAVFIVILGIILTIYLLTSSGKESFVLDRTPLFAGRNNLAQNLDRLLSDNLARINLNTDLSNDTLFGESCSECNTDFVKLKKGQVSSQLWVARAGCTESSRVSDAIRQLDVIDRMIKNYSDYLQLVRTTNDLEDAIDNKKVGSFMFVDGGQSIMDSTSFLRLFDSYGVRAMSLATGCENPNMTNYIVEKDNLTLTEFGKTVIEEMNRLGMMIDIQGLPNSVQEEILNKSMAPVMVSHAASATIFKQQENIDDKTLNLLKSNKGLLMITFDAPYLESGDNITISDVIKHLDYIADRIGFDNIAIGGNYDSVYKKATGLEDVSDFPSLFTELTSRKKWSAENLDKLAGQNFQRFFKDVQNVSKR